MRGIHERATPQSGARCVMASGLLKMRQRGSLPFDRTEPGFDRSLSNVQSMLISLQETHKQLERVSHTSGVVDDKGRRVRQLKRRSN